MDLHRRVLRHDFKTMRKFNLLKIFLIELNRFLIASQKTGIFDSI